MAFSLIELCLQQYFPIILLCTVSCCPPRIGASIYRHPYAGIGRGGGGGGVYALICDV